MTRRTLLGLVLTALVAAPGVAQTMDEIVERSLKARGGVDKLRAVKTLRITGRMAMGGLEAPVTLEFKRPNQMRMEFTVQGMTGVQAYDGKTGWNFIPFAGMQKPQPMSPEELKLAEEQADMDGPLLDYKAKGNTVELVGKEAVEGTQAHKLKVTLKNGTIRYLYVDAEHFLEIKMEGKQTIRGTETEVEASMGDFKEVEGLMLAHAVQSGAKGSPQRQTITVQKIEINPPLDDARFKMPEK